MGSRRRARELALQLLFQQDLTDGVPEEILEVFWSVHSATRDNRQYAEFLFWRTLRDVEEIDHLIGAHAEHWRIDRMATVDRNLLRMAVAELLQGETPQAVVIDEAIELARKYSTAESSQFVNGVLDAIREQLEATERK